MLASNFLCLFCAQFGQGKTLKQVTKLNNYVPHLFLGCWPSGHLGELQRQLTSSSYLSLCLSSLSHSVHLLLAELCHAALKIQSTFRGHLARKLVNKDVPEDEDIQEITKKVAEELDIDLTDPELNKAATKIQASFRGHKTRKEANPE